MDAAGTAGSADEFPKAPICCYLPYLSACGPPQTSPDPSPGLRAAQEGLQEPQEGLEELIFDEISVIWVQAGYFDRGKALGGLFGPRKNPGRAILAAEKPWSGYFGREKTLVGLFVGCGKTWAGVILARKKPCACAHSGNLTHRLCIFDT